MSYPIPKVPERAEPSRWVLVAFVLRHFEHHRSMFWPDDLELPAEAVQRASDIVSEVIARRTDRTATITLDSAVSMLDDLTAAADAEATP